MVSVERFCQSRLQHVNLKTVLELRWRNDQQSGARCFKVHKMPPVLSQIRTISGPFVPPKSRSIWTPTTSTIRRNLSRHCKFGWFFSYKLAPYCTDAPHRFLERKLDDLTYHREHLGKTSQQNTRWNNQSSNNGHPFIPKKVLDYLRATNL